MTTNKAPAKNRRLSPVSDVDVIDPQASEAITLENGTQVEVVPLRSRQFFKLMRILTNGAGDALMNARLDSSDSEDVFGAKLIAAILFAIPEAEDQAIDFITSMVRPVGLIERRDMDSASKERNLELWENALEALENPALDDTVAIIERIVQRETPNLKALGKRLVETYAKTQK